MFDWRDLDSHNTPLWRRRRHDDDPPAGWIVVIIYFAVLGLLILFVWYLISHTKVGAEHRLRFPGTVIQNDLADKAKRRA